MRPVAIVGSRASGAGGDAKKVSQAPATADASQARKATKEEIKGQRSTYNLTHLDGVCVCVS